MREMEGCIVLESHPKRENRTIGAEQLTGLNRGKTNRLLLSV